MWDYIIFMLRVIVDVVFFNQQITVINYDSPVCLSNYEEVTINYVKLHAEPTEGKTLDISEWKE